MIKRQQLKRYQKGQGIAGFIVGASFFLIPSMLALNYLAKVGDGRHHQYQAARYAAWERTVWHESDGQYNRKSNAQLVNEIDKRIYGRQEAVLNSREDKTDVAPTELEYFHSLRVHDAVAQDEPFLISQETDSPYLSRPDFNNGRSTQGIASAVQPIADIFGLSSRGLYNLAVSNTYNKVDILREELGQSDFVTTANNAMIVGPWNGTTPGRIRSNIRNTLLYKDVMDAYGIVGSALGYGFFLYNSKEFDRYDPGKVDIDRVPCQRLLDNRGRTIRGGRPRYRC